MFDFLGDVAGIAALELIAGPIGWVVGAAIFTFGGDAAKDYVESPEGAQGGQYINDSSPS